MIELKRVAVRCVAESGPFAGDVRFASGLNIISAPNGYGKSLVAKAIGWCLGLEPMFGLPPNDSSRFPGAVTDRLKVDSEHEASVLVSEASIELFRADADGIRLTRGIKSDDTSVRCDVIAQVGGEPRRSFALEPRVKTFADESGGLQNYLFEWMGIRKYSLITNRRAQSPLYLENLAPHFIIDQEHGWSDIQSLQVHRYGIIDVGAASVEALLGADRAIEARRLEQERLAWEAERKASADLLVLRVREAFQRLGFPPVFERPRGLEKTVEDWRAIDLVAYARSNFNFDINREGEHFERKIAELCSVIAGSNPDAELPAPVRSASQRVVDLKARRHQLLQKSRDMRYQLQEQRDVASALHHRVQSSKDLLRLKESGIGRMTAVDCPTCHRPVQLDDFGVHDHAIHEIRDHLSALAAEEGLFRRNMESTLIGLQQVQAEMGKIDQELESANRALQLVNSAVGSKREQLAKAATDLASAETEMARMRAFHQELVSLQDALRAWALAGVGADGAADDGADDLLLRAKTLAGRVGEYLVAFGHSAVPTGTQHKVKVEPDDDYEPYIAERKLRSLGSASDHARLVAAFALALAEVALELKGNHPGLVLLDEPLQQNPDQAHREQFVEALIRLKAEPRCQAIILTSLLDEEIMALLAKGVPVTVLPGTKLLRPETAPAS